MTNFIRLQIMYLNEYYYCYMLKLMQKIKIKEMENNRQIGSKSFIFRY